MGLADVQVPVSLLLNHELAASAKLIWMLLRSGGPAGPSRLAVGSRLSRTTTGTGLQQLLATGWCSAGAGTRAEARAEARDEARARPKPEPRPEAKPEPRPQAKPEPGPEPRPQANPEPRPRPKPEPKPEPRPEPRAEARASASPGARPRAMIPSELLADARLNAHAVLLYGVLQVTPGFRHPTGLTSYAALASLAGTCPRTTRTAISHLASTGWLDVVQKNQAAPIRFTLRNLAWDRALTEVTNADLRLREATYDGEAIMREYLSLLIECDQYQDNATPGFLNNPYTDEPLQLDRYYPPAVAFEYHGPQHFGPTKRFSARQAAFQRGRDLMKLGMCLEKGITLQVVTSEDLSLQSMQQKVGNLLPLRGLNGHEPLIDFLEATARHYRETAKRYSP